MPKLYRTNLEGILFNVEGILMSGHPDSLVIQHLDSIFEPVCRRYKSEGFEIPPEYRERAGRIRELAQDTV